MSELEVALAAVRAAARVTLKVRPEPKPLEGGVLKEDRSPVTIGDFAAQAVVCAAIQDAYPEDLVIGEEAADSLRTPEGAELLAQIVELVRSERPGATSEQVCDWIDRGGRREPAPRAWTLDPIDGTKGFLRGDQYAVALALIEEGQVQLGAIVCPALPVEGTSEGPRGVVAWGQRGQGAFQVPLAGGEPVRLSVSTAPAAESRQLESVEPGHHDRERAGRIRAALGLTREPVRLDSMAKYLVLARGDAELYLRLTRPGYQQKIWDHAAGSILVEEAGGRISDLSGKAPDFGQGAYLDCEGGLVVSSGVWHDEALGAVAQG